jgi:membrane associated rhomboid family serine protease
MLFPISDDNPTRITPVVSYALIALNVVVFALQGSIVGGSDQAAVYSYGLIPARLFGDARLPPELAVVPAWATVLSSMFLHGGLLHLGGNMLFLWIFGDNIEESMGHVRFGLFYLLGGVAAALTQGLLDPASTVPMIGASGAVSAVLGAYILLHPWATIRVFVFLGIFATVAHVPAIVVLGIWFAGQFLSAATTPVGEPGVAFWAHIGGFAAGFVLVPVFRRRGVGLIQPPRSRPFEVERRRGPWG